MARSRFDCQDLFEAAPGHTARFWSLPKFDTLGFGSTRRFPVSLRVLFESVLRNCDGQRIREEDLLRLAAWKPQADRTEEVPFVVSRVLLQDFTGVPLLVDLAAMRSALERRGQSPQRVEPSVPVDLVIDHSVQVDSFALPEAPETNLALELSRNRARYEFLKWGTQAFKTLRIVPPGIGICHQVNLEYLAEGVCERDGVCFPDTLVGTDSHTTMINGLGIVGFGVGGIEAEAAMLGQPVYLLMPDVVGVHLTGQLPPGTTATDLVLRVTEMLRAAKVVGKFVEFFGPGARALRVSDRATIANMAPEYGATIGYFPVDERCCEYLTQTGRSAEQVEKVRRYYQAQGLFGIPAKGECDYSQELELDLGTIRPSVAGPKRPQDRIELGALKQQFQSLLSQEKGGYGRKVEESRKRHAVILWHKPRNGPSLGGGSQDCDTLPEGRRKGTNSFTELEMMNNRPTPNPRQGNGHPQIPSDVGDGDVLIAAITSCTNTSNPSVMLAAGLLAKKAVEKGLTVRPTVKTSLAPGSRVVTAYLDETGLTPYLEKLGFSLVGYGCTTCIGNSGPLAPELEAVIAKNELVAASVLSGNRNFEARIHQSIKANFLMSPPLVVAFALAGKVGIDLEREPLGTGRDGEEVYLRDLWPTTDEIEALLAAAREPATYRRLYGAVREQSPQWNAIPAPTGVTYRWDGTSTYIREPPYFLGDAAPESPIENARVLAIFGDMVTTDHISPAGAIKATSPAGLYLKQKGVAVEDFNSYGARRGNHEVMIRGTFANVRIRNRMVASEGGQTRHFPSGRELSIFDAASTYQKENVPLVVFAGQEYGAGSSRDWAAKGTRLLGVRAVIAQSFERIHRSNLVGMGVLPCQFENGTSAESLKLDGSERIALEGMNGTPTPRQTLTLVITRGDGRKERVPVIARLDTPIERAYFARGGIMPFVLDGLAGREPEPAHV